MSNKPVNGEYFSPFYTINIDTKTSVTQFNKDPEIMKSLSHEYLHFIQDLSLTYNFAYASHVYSKIAHFYNEKKKKISLPYTIPIKYFNCYRNEKLFTTYSQGYSKNERKTIPNWTSNFHISISSHIACQKGLFLFFPGIKEYRVEIIIDKNYSLTVKFGALAIMEGMCRLFEDHLYPVTNSSINTYQIPYDLPLMVVKHIYPQVLIHKSILFALCEASLMYYNPAQVFILALKKMKEEKFIPKKLIDVYKFIYSRIVFKKQSIRDIWKHTFKELDKNTKNVCNLKEVQFSLRRAKYSYVHFFRMRIRSPDFLAKLLLQPYKQAQSQFYLIMQSIPSPLISNNAEPIEYGFIGNIPNDPIKRFALFHWNNMRLMYDFIFKSEGDICTFGENCPFFESCDYSFTPSLKPETPPYCNFTQYSRSFGLYLHQIKLKTEK